MKRTTLIVAALWGLSVAAAFAADPAANTNIPAAPSGSLPAGHPDISQMQPRQFPGAAGPANAAGVTLPAGHPEIPGMTSPTTQPSAKLGTLLVRAQQNTPGAASIGAEPMVIEVYVHGELLDRIDAKLDEKGTASLGGIPLKLGAQAIARVSHAGVDFQAVSPVMDPMHPNAEVVVNVYETTDQTPAWNIRMRHVIVRPAEGGVSVMEMLALENPSDRAWIGKAAAGGGRETLRLKLPANARQIQLTSGFNDGAAKIEGSTVSSGMALLPGSTELRLSYAVPAEDGRVNLSVVSPADSSAVMVMLPDDDTQVAAEGLEPAGAVDMGQGRTRFYRAASVPAGTELKVSISGVAAAPIATARTTGASTRVAQLVAGAGALVIVLAGAAFLLFKSAPKKALR